MHATRRKQTSDSPLRSRRPQKPYRPPYNLPHPNNLVPHHQATALPTCQTPIPATVCNPRHSVMLPAYPTIPLQPPFKPIPNQLPGGYTSALNLCAASWLAGDGVAAARKPRATERTKRVSRGRSRRQVMFSERCVQRMLVGKSVRTVTR